MFKFERSLYSLRSIGCKNNAFIYKQFCQSIVRFGLEKWYLVQDQLNQLNVRQNMLLRNVIGLKHGTRTKVLLNELKIENIRQIYLKHKVFGLRQFYNNFLTKELLVYLEVYYDGKVISRQSFMSQLKEVEAFTGSDLSDWKESILVIDRRFQCNDIELRQLVFTILKNFSINNSYLYNINLLNNILKNRL